MLRLTDLQPCQLWMLVNLTVLKLWNSKLNLSCMVWHVIDVPVATGYLMDCFPNFKARQLEWFVLKIAKLKIKIVIISFRAKTVTVNSKSQNVSFEVSKWRHQIGKKIYLVARYHILFKIFIYIFIYFFLILFGWQFFLQRWNSHLFNLICIKNEQVVCSSRKMLFPIFKYVFFFKTYISDWFSTPSVI